MNRKSPGPGRKLLSALTQPQLESLLDAVGPQTLLEKVAQDREKSDADMVSTVKAVLQSDGTPEDAQRKVGRVASASRLIEDWRGLWRRWDEIVGEVGDEEGKYSVQDHHWEEPYFDGSAVAADLEPVAAEMLKQIEEVFDLVGAPELFTKAIDEIDQAIKSYPGWMGADSGDGCMLEGQTTNCVLRWLWLASQNETGPGVKLLKRVEEIERRSGCVGLDRKATVDFITGLPDPVCREIHGELQHGRFREEQAIAYSQWNAIAHELERRYDQGLYLERCVRDLAKNWHNGEPLIKKAMADDDWHAAESWLVKTFASYRHGQNGPPWHPEQTLLIADDQAWREDAETGRAAKLLELWSKVSEKLDHHARRLAARFQAVALRGPEQFERIIEEFKVLRDEKAPESLGTLFKQWQDEMTQRSLRVYRGENRFRDTWIHWAVAAQTESNGKDRFRNKLDAWLNTLSRSGPEFSKQWELLACLTNDLTDASAQRKRFPGLFKTAVGRFGCKTSLEKSRSAAVSSLCPSGTMDTVTEVWKKQFTLIVPDPSRSSNDYREPVAWAKALLELNPDAYSHLVKHWLSAHHRRRNLWKAMQKARLPVIEG